MYVGEVLGKTIKLTDKEYEILKKLWHIDNIITSTIKSHYIRGNWSWQTWVFYRRFLRSKKIYVTFYGLHFDVSITMVKKYIQKIQDMLNTFEKEGRNEPST